MSIVDRNFSAIHSLFPGSASFKEAFALSWVFCQNAQLLMTDSIVQLCKAL